MPELVPGIDQDPDKRGGEPCVAGTRVPVRRIGHLADQRIGSAEIADRFDLSVSDVHRALAYYHDHSDEMERYDRRDRSLETSAGDETETFEEALDRLQSD